MRSPAPLQDGGGSHIITVGVFLTPMTPGTHEVTIHAELHGPPVVELLTGSGAEVYAADFTYTVTVVPGR